jgi:TonB family protein
VRERDNPGSVHPRSIAFPKSKEVPVRTQIIVVYGLFVASVFTASLAAQSTSSSPQTSVGATTASAPHTVGSSEPSTIDPSKEADIRRLLDLTGAAKLGMQAMDVTEKNMRPLLSNSFPPGEYREKLIDLFFAKFRSKFGAQQLVDFALPVYDRHFTDEEIKGLIQFYETPLGQKMASAQPELFSETQEAGKKWAGIWARESIFEVLSENPDLAAAYKSAREANKAAAPSSMPPANETGGVIGNILSQTPASSSGSASPQRVRVASGIAAGLLVSKVDPVYPPVARQARVQGTVLLQAHIGRDGSVQDLQLISGHPLLAPAAIDAVKQWRYTPYLLNGTPVDVETQIQVNFTLSQ